MQKKRKFIRKQILTFHLTDTN